MANELDIETEEIIDDTIPEPVEIEIAGKPYTFHWSKDYWWVQYYNALAGRGHDAFKASMDLIEVSISASDLRDIESRLRHDRNLDLDDLIAALLDLTIAWHEHVVDRLHGLGVSIPEKVKAHIGKKSGKQTSGKKVVKAPGARKR